MSRQVTFASLGRLERVDLREIWENEATGFTPWLAEPENLALLAGAVGLELELEAQEKTVGPFRADLLCKDVATDHWVLVENQLARTDHVHLGQLLTYASGLKAVTIVWVAAHFTEEHRAALDWLNDITDDRFNFFGLEIEAWRIGSSSAAPKFNVVSKPNDWSRQVSERASEIGNLTPTKQLQLDFWTEFRAYAEEHAERIHPTKPLPQHWMNMALGRSGTGLAAIASVMDSVNEGSDNNELRAEVNLSGSNAAAFYEGLRSQKREIEEELKEQLAWHNPESTQSSKMYLRRAVDLHDRERWPEYHEWLVAKLDSLYRVFSHRVRALDLDEFTGLELDEVTGEDSQE